MGVNGFDNGTTPDQGDHQQDHQDQAQNAAPAKGRRKSKKDGEEAGKKRRCISSACVPCRKRKSKVCITPYV